MVFNVNYGKCFVRCKYPKGDRNKEIISVENQCKNYWVGKNTTKSTVLVQHGPFNNRCKVLM